MSERWDSASTFTTNTSPLRRGSSRSLGSNLTTEQNKFNNLLNNYKSQTIKTRQTKFLGLFMFFLLFFIVVGAISYRYWDNPECRALVGDDNLTNAMFISIIIILTISSIGIFVVVGGVIVMIRKGKGLNSQFFNSLVIMIGIVLFAASISILVYIHTSVSNRSCTNDSTSNLAPTITLLSATSCNKDVNFDVVAGLVWTMCIIILLCLIFCPKDIFNSDPLKIIIPEKIHDLLLGQSLRQ